MGAGHPADMNINGTAAAYLIVTPDAGKKRFTHENAVRMSDKILNDKEPWWNKLD